MSFNWGSVLGALGTAAGAYYGGAEGAQAGGAIGSGLGGSFDDEPAATGTGATGTSPEATPTTNADGSFDWSSIIPAVVAGATTLFGGMAQGDIAEEERKDKEKQANLNTLLNLQLEGLKMKYMQPALPTPVWNPLAMKLGERGNMQQEANLAQVKQLNELMSSYKGALGR